MVLKALELFAGIGGITHGLREYVEPIAFCEYEKDAAAFLSQRGLPVHGDVTKFDATMYKNKVDMVTAGWPCTGFSTAGKGAGFAHEASGLWTEVVRIVKECEPTFVFLENSHVLARRENLEIIVHSLNDLGYDTRWFSCKSHDVKIGAPHRRFRWFCLAFKKNSKINVPKIAIKKFDWRDPPEKQHPKNTFENKRLLKFMGNSVVPDQVRHAFEMIIDMKRNGKEPTANIVRCGYSLDGRIFEVEVSQKYIPPVNIRLYPKELPETHRVPNENDIVHEPVTYKFWNTPCFVHATSAKGAKVLTKRGVKFLPCQVKYLKDGEIDEYLSGKFSAWLMGYDEEYLDYLSKY